jgi:hypothetical protein
VTGPIREGGPLPGIAARTLQSDGAVTRDGVARAAVFISGEQNMSNRRQHTAVAWTSRSITT